MNPYMEAYDRGANPDELDRNERLRRAGLASAQSEEKKANPYQQLYDSHAQVAAQAEETAKAPQKDWRSGPDPTVHDEVSRHLDGSPEDGARAANSMALAETLGVDPGVTYKHFNSLTGQLTLNGFDPKLIPAKEHGFGETVWNAAESSVIGLIFRGKAPEAFQPSGLTEELVHSWLTMALDLPVMMLGAAGGGGIVGAFVLPAVMRKALMDNYTKGGAKTWSEFIERSADILKEGVKAAIVGKATELAGGLPETLARRAVAGPLSLGQFKGTQLAKAMSEIGAMTAVGKWVEGEVPTAKDFLIGAGGIGLLHLGMKGVEKGMQKAAPYVEVTREVMRDKLETLYRDRGIHPKDAATEIDARLSGEKPPTEADVDKAIQGLLTDQDIFELGNKLKPEEKDQIRTQIEQLGDINKVNETFADDSDQSKYARLVAPEILGSSEESAVLPSELATKAAEEGQVSRTDVLPSGEKIEPEATSQAKQPWEMTRGEWVSKRQDLEHQWNISPREKLGEIAPQIRELNYGQDRKGTWNEQHEEIIKQALAEGKNIPPEVLAEYPELTTKSNDATLDQIRTEEPAYAGPERRATAQKPGEPRDRRDHQRREWVLNWWEREGIKRRNNGEQVDDVALWKEGLAQWDVEQKRLSEPKDQGFAKKLIDTTRDGDFTYKIVRIDGEAARNNVNEEITDTEHSMNFPEIPDDEFWIDETVKDHEIPIEVARMVVEKQALRAGKDKELAYILGQRKEEELRAQTEIGKKVATMSDDEVHVAANRGVLKQRRTKNDIEIRLVDGEYYKCKFNVDFTEGGHDIRYPWLPPNTIVIMNTAKPEERPYIIAHETHERVDMKKGMQYDAAHERASEYEHNLRENPELLSKAPEMRGLKAILPKVKVFKEARAGKKGAHGMLGRMKELGGVNWGEGYNVKESKQNPDLKRTYDKNGMSADEMAEVLIDEGYIGDFTDGDSMRTHIESGNARNTFSPEHRERLDEIKANKEHAEWLERELANLAEREGVDRGSISKNEERLTDSVTDALGEKGTIHDESAVMREVVDLFEEVKTGKMKVSEDTVDMTGGAFDEWNLVGAPGEVGAKGVDFESKSAEMFPKAKEGESAEQRYDKALEQFRKQYEPFRDATNKFRNKEISTEEYLAAREEFEKAKLVLDNAEKAFSEESPPTIPLETLMKSDTDLFDNIQKGHLDELQDKMAEMDKAGLKEVKDLMDEEEAKAGDKGRDISKYCEKPGKGFTIL
jgi:hypothetical protein